MALCLSKQHTGTCLCQATKTAVATIQPEEGSTQTVVLNLEVGGVTDQNINRCGRLKEH